MLWPMRSSHHLPHRRTVGAAVAVLLCLLAPLVLSACGASSGATTSGSIKVVATTTQLGDIVRQVAGNAAQVTQILRPNSDPHEYEPRPSDIVASANARIVFESGNNLDRWMAKIVDQAGGHPTVVILSDFNVDRVAGETSGPEASTYDPHWWHDPRNVEAAIPAIRDALTRANPADRATYAANAAAYLARVKTLDVGIARCFAAVPASERKLVTDHDAFNYFARRYGITIVGAVIPSQTTEAEPSAGGVAQLVRTIRREHVKAVFPETSVNKKLAQAIAGETGASASYTLYGDTLGPQGSAGATYLTMEQANADQMVRGFTGGRSGCSIRGI